MDEEIHHNQPLLLTESNYIHWSGLMILHFKMIGADKYVLNNHKPETILDPAEKKMYFRATTTIVKGVSPQLRYLVRTYEDDPESTNPYRLWKSLEHKFDPKPNSPKRQFFVMDLPNEKVIFRINQNANNKVAEELKQDTSSHDDPSADARAALLKLKNKTEAFEKLMEEFDTERGIITSDDRLTVLIEGIKQRYPLTSKILETSDLSYEEAVIFVSEHCSSPQETEPLNLFSNSQKSKISSKKSQTCTFCGKKGHVESVCWTKEKKQHQRQRQRRSLYIF
jgi:hypothetical protein